MSKEFNDLERGAQAGVPRAEKPNGGYATSDSIFEEIAVRYERENGNVLNTDSVKRLFADEGYDPTDEESVRAFHPRAARLTGRLFQRWLKTKKGVGNNTVVFLGGGNGSGKSTGSVAYECASFVMDSTMTSLEATASRIQQVINAGYQPVIRFVYRDFVDAWCNGVLARKEAGGHITPKSVFANSHATVRKNLDSLLARFGDAISIDVFANGSSDVPVRIALDQLRAMPLPSKQRILEAIHEQADRTAEEGFGGSGRKGPTEAG